MGVWGIVLGSVLIVAAIAIIIVKSHIEHTVCFIQNEIGDA